MIDQTAHEHYPEENSLPSPNFVEQANLVYTKSEQNPPVSY